jgi:pimeloyl-ACP methyl ester carboxylesterase
MRRTHVLVATIALALLVSPLGSVRAQDATPPATSVPRFTQTVTVDGRHLGLTCVGSGSPTVVLVGGLRLPAEDVWPPIFDAIRPLTRICVFDRAGMGPSDPQPHTPQTAADVVADLHAALTAAGGAGPFVPVGFSIGGLFVRLYASTYPGEVAGLILVEGAPPGIYGPDVPPDLGVAAPIDFFPSEEQVRAALPSPQVPTVAIVAGKLNPSEIQGTVEETLELEMEQARDLSARVIIAEESGHFVPLDQPEVVVAAIEDVVAAVRDPSRWATPMAATPAP